MIIASEFTLSTSQYLPDLDRPMKESPTAYLGDINDNIIRWEWARGLVHITGIQHLLTKDARSCSQVIAHAELFLSPVSTEAPSTFFFSEETAPQKGE